MRTQTWEQSQLIEDREICRKAGVAIVKDCLAETERPATVEEEASLVSEERLQKQVKAKAELIQAILDNATQTPWGKIFYSLAVSQGWIEGE